MPDLRVTYFVLKLDGTAAGWFKECSGLPGEPTVAEQGATSLQTKFPGQAKWSNLVLRRGVDDAGRLWAWRKLVIDGNIEEARADGQIAVVDGEGNAVATFSFSGAWPCRYSAPGLNAGGNEILVEEIEIAHEGLE